MRSIGVYLFSSLGSSYLAISQIEKFGLELLETTPLGSSAQIIVRGEEDSITQFQKSLRVGDLLRSKIIVECDQRVIETYFHINTSKLEEEIFVFEASFLGEIIEVCNQGIKVDLSPVEIRFPRFSSAKINLIMTGKANSRTGAFLQDVYRKKILCHHIKEPGKTLKSLFVFEEN